MMFFRPNPRRVVDDELEFHLEMQVRRYMAEGMSREEALTAARERFGDVEGVRGECHTLADRIEGQVRRAELISELQQDLSYAIRTLRRTPLYTSIALLTLAIGIGANTAIFSVVNATLLRPLPYRHADRVMTIWNGTGTSRSERTAVAVPEFADYVAQTTSFDALAALRVTPMTFSVPCTGDACAPEQIVTHSVTPNFFDVLGTTPSLGRTFSSDEGIATPASVAMLSYELWRRHGSDTSIVGRTVFVNGLPRTVIGVAAPEMRFPDAPVGFVRGAADVYLPASYEKRVDERGNQYLAVFARLRPGATVETARRDLAQVADQFRREFPRRYVQTAPTWRIVSLPLAEDMFGDARPMLLVVFGAAALVLLIACANVANLTLARGTARAKELAVRTALGAGRSRLVRQILTESVFLSIVGGLLGVTLAYGALPWLIQLDPGNVPRFDSTRVDPTALAFSIVLSALAGLAFGLVPAFRLSSADPRSSFTQDSSRAGQGVRGVRVRRALVIAQVALSVTILVGAGLLVRSFAALQRVSPGFVASEVQTFRVAFPSLKYDSAYKRIGATARIADALREMPDAERVSGVYPLPMSGDGWSGTFHIEGRPEEGGSLPHAESSVALPGYFATMGIPLLAGRDFSERDAASAPLVAVIDDNLARRYWPGESPIGKRVSTVGVEGPWMEVVGVVAHVRREGPRNDGEPQLYMPALQRPQPAMYFVARGPAPTQFATSARERVRAVDRDLVIARVSSMVDLEASAITRERFTLVLFSAFGLVGLTVAAIGVFGVMAYLVAQRRQEIAVRMALGSRRSGIVSLVTREALSLTAAGLAIGLIASIASSRLLAGLLFGVTGTDPLTYIVISLVLLVVTTIAATGPALRAARTDPANALRG